MVPVSFVVLFLETFCSMDPFYYPKASPIEEGVSLRYSVAYYSGRRRIVIAWFPDFDAAMDFLKSSRRDKPYLKYDLCNSLF